jgi:phosphoadenosine phosphosulfate reductase
MELTRKIDFAIKLLQSIPQDGPIELSYSGGKDSDVILELARMSGIPFEPIYKNTTIDPPGTLAHCREQGVKIIQPKMSFLEIVRQKGFPSRFTRFCCEILKEYKIHDRAIQGIRRAESTKRAKLYKEPEICRTYSKTEKARIYLPILEWTDDDVATFIKDRSIRCAPIYYDGGGQFHVERRLGCIGCPLASAKLRREQYKKYPYVFKSQLNACKEFYNNKPNSAGAQLFRGDVYKKFAADLFFDRDPKQIMSQGLFEMPDAKKFLEEYFGIEL